MIITTSEKPSQRAAEQAARLATELSAELMPRKQMSAKKLLSLSADHRLIVVTEQEVRFYDGQSETPFFFHPSMAFVRVKRLRRGEPDPLITISGCQAGDIVIDCTAGLAGDSLVFAYAAGENGQVIGLESEPILSALVREGLAQYRSGLDDVDAAMRRISLTCANHHNYISGLPDNSADIVYFDPMFRRPVLESSSMEPLRSMANMNAISDEVVQQAKRVARRRVLLKEHQSSGEFARLGFERHHVNTSKIAYGVIEIE